MIQEGEGHWPNSSENLQKARCLWVLRTPQHNKEEGARAKKLVTCGTRGPLGRGRSVPFSAQGAYCSALSQKRLRRDRNSFLVRGVAVNRKSPPSKYKIQTETCKRAACGQAVPPYHRVKPIYLPSNATDASRGRPPAFFETFAGPSTLRASRLRIPRRAKSAGSN